jgi:hypothetical protein
MCLWQVVSENLKEKGAKAQINGLAHKNEPDFLNYAIAGFQNAFSLLILG